MSTHFRSTVALAALALSLPAMAQTKDKVQNEVKRLEQQVNLLAPTNPALAAQFKQRALLLRQSITPRPTLSAPASGSNGGHSSNIVGPNYVTFGPCGAYDAGTAGNTVSAASTSGPIAILDYATVSDSVAISGLGTQTFDVDLTVAITHTWCADMVITLTSPGGTTAAVSGNRGADNDDVFNGTLFDDESTNPIASYPFTNGVAAPDLQPDQSFNGNFRGENPNGNWVLAIADVAGGDVGFLNSWSLAVTDGTIISIPPAFNPPAIFSSGPISVPVLDNSTAIAPLLVSGGPATIGQAEVYVAITHTWCADMLIEVQSPAGTLVTLSSNRGGSFDDVFNGTLFSMFSSNPIASYVFTNGVAAPDLQPDGNLAAFAGENSNGTWNLVVTDSATLDEGIISRFDVRLGGGGCAPQGTPYCVAKANSLGCLPAISSTGQPSASSGSGFVVTGVNLRNNKPSMLVYTNAGRAATPFFGGTLCISAPIRRGLTVSAGGNPAPVSDCSGVNSLDMNAFAAGTLGGGPAAFLLLPGTVVDAQIWSRDQGFAAPNNASLTEGLEWTVGG